MIIDNLRNDTNIMKKRAGRIFCRLCFSLILFTYLFFNKSVAQTAIIPFNDESGFKSRWNLSIEVPNFLRVYLNEKLDLGLVSPRIIDNFFKRKGIDSANYQSVDNWKLLAKELKIKYVIFGAINTFSLSKFTAGFPLLAGYESFSTAQSITYKIFDISEEKIITSGDLNHEISDKGLGITLAGKPTDRNKEYNSIDNIKFGSEEFKKTIVGESMLKIAIDFSYQLERYVPLLRFKAIDDYKDPEDDSIFVRKEYIYGKVLFIDKDDTFINLGSSDELEIGERLLILFPDFKANRKNSGMEKYAGSLEVKEIRSQHLSIGRITEGKDVVKENFIIQKITIK